MKAAVKVSVLMSVYNNVRTVDESIRSIVAQTYTDWEMILWNDASADGSLQRLLHWQTLDKRIRVFSNERNMGLAASLNLALEKSCGNYIARMDGDDVSFPDRFSKQTAFLDENPQYALVGSNSILFDADGEWGERCCIACPRKSDFLWGSQFMHPTIMIRKSALKAVNGYRVSHDTLRTEDYDLFMRLYAAGYQGYNLNTPLLRYYENRKPRHVKYTQRISEAKIRYQGFKELGLLPKGYVYIAKPLVVALIPGFMKRRLQGNHARQGS